MNRFLKHGLIWLVFYGVYTFMLSINGNLYMVMLFNLVNVILFMLAYYSLRHVQLPLLYDKGKKVEFVLSLIVSSFALYGIYRFCLNSLHGLWGFDGRIRYDRSADFLVKVIRFYSPAMVLLALESHFKGRREQARIRKLEKENLTNELKYLKAQINPHFLFNSLQSLYEYVITDSPKAPDMIMRLSGILDYVLYKSQQPFVPLHEEIEAVENFLKLEQIRFGEQLDIEFNVKGDHGVLISPLILMSILEHTFKNEISTEQGKQKVKIDIIVEGNAFEFSLESRPSKDEWQDMEEGIKMANIQRQLALVYPDRYDLKMSNSDTMNMLKLKIDLNHE